MKFLIGKKKQLLHDLANKDSLLLLVVRIGNEGKRFTGIFQ
jgi:hypothetical protein